MKVMRHAEGAVRSGYIARRPHTTVRRCLRSQHRLFSAQVAGIMFAVIDTDIGMLWPLIDVCGVELQKLTATAR